jgi:hypothetical protein
MAEYKNCICFVCENRRVKQKITNYEWKVFVEVFIQKNKII